MWLFGLEEVGLLGSVGEEDVVSALRRFYDRPICESRIG